MKTSIKSLIYLMMLPSSVAVKVETWNVLDTTLSKPLSDLTATVDPTSNYIYLAGGCDSIKGNERAPWDNMLFYCASITNKFSVFDPTTEMFLAGITDAPRPRYRHAAAYANGHIWLFGGRDADDNIIQQVDVYDIENGLWLSNDINLSLTEDNAVSDLAAFTIEDDYIYIAGGYNVAYEAVTQVLKIDPAASLTQKTLVFEVSTPLQEGRGDAHATTIKGNKAIITGGFTHKDEWCEALSTVEMFDASEVSWTFLDELTYQRGDKALVTVDETTVYAIGGETNTDCSADPKQRTTPTTQVEVLDTSAMDTAKWTEEVADVPDDHFRFPAAAVDDTIYTFGGQRYYNGTCDCFPTRDTIMKYVVVDDEQEHESSGLSTGAIVSIAIFCTIVVIIITIVGTLLYQMVQRKGGVVSKTDGGVVEGDETIPATDMDGTKKGLE